MVNRLRHPRRDRLPVRSGDVFALYTEAVTLAAVHPLRRSRCLMCGAPIGGRSCRFTSIVVADPPACGCGQVPTITQLVCAEHWPLNVVDLARAATRLAETAHPDGVQACQG